MPRDSFGDAPCTRPHRRALLEAWRAKEGLPDEKSSPYTHLLYALWKRGIHEEPDMREVLHRVSVGTR